MEPFGIGGMAALAAGTALVLFVSVLRSRRRMRRAALAAGPAGPEPRTSRRPARGTARLAAIEAAQADLAARVEALVAQGAPEERMQAMAQQLVGLIRDKNATFETAIAGLDQLRARMRALEEMGEPAEARALLDRLGARIDALVADQAAGAAASAARITALEQAGDNPFAEIADQLTRLYAQKDAGLAALLARLGPLEDRLAGLEGGAAAAVPAREEVVRMEARLTALQEAQGAVQADLAALRSEAGPAVEIAARLEALHAGKEALAETVLARLTAVEAGLAERDPHPVLDRFAERLEGLRAAQAASETALRDRLEALEAPRESPFAEISDQLAGLYAQKDATVETVFARLAPLEAKLAEMDGRLAGLDPQAALDRFAERVEARIAALESSDDNPFAEISDQLTRLYAQKDATVETVFARLAPLEAKLAEMDGRLAGLDPQAALDRFAERVEARIAALEDPGDNPFAEISDQLTRLYAQKDATVETVFARLAPLEAKLGHLELGLAERDPQAALDRFAERLEGLRAAHDAAAAGLRDRIAALEAPGESPFAEISDQLTRLYAQKDATVETVFARLAPLEAKLGAVETRLGAIDPQDVLERFAERLEATRGALEGRIAALEAPGESPFAEISDQLTRLYAQKDATVETVFARLAPLEAKLGQIEADLAGQDPRAALDRFAERLETVQGRIAALESSDDNPFAEISDQLTRLYAQKDATVETVFARLAPLEAKLGEIEGGMARLAPLAEADPRAALDGLGARLEGLNRAQGELAAGFAAMKAAGEDAAARTAPLAEIADQLTRLFAQKDGALTAVLARIAPLEARLAELEDRPWDPDAEEARVQAQAIATQMIALRAAAEQTEGIADRLALLEASLPKLSSAQTLLMQVLERQAMAGLPMAEPRPDAVLPMPGLMPGPMPAPPPVPKPAAAAPPRSGPPQAAASDMEEVWTLPRLVSLHRK
jgi:chromosome segregation ATPase